MLYPLESVFYSGFNILVATLLLVYRSRSGLAPETVLEFLLLLVHLTWIGFSYYVFIDAIGLIFTPSPTWMTLLFLTLTGNVIVLTFLVAKLESEVDSFGLYGEGGFFARRNTERNLRFWVQSGKSDKAIRYLKRRARLESDREAFDELHAIQERKNSARHKLNLKEMDHDNYYFEEHDVDNRLLKLIDKWFTNRR